MAFYRRQVTKMCAFSKNNYATRNFRMIFFVTRWQRLTGRAGWGPRGSGGAVEVSVLCQVKLCAPQSAFINICRWPSALTKVCMSSRQIFGHVVQVQAHVDHILFDDNLFERTLASQPQLGLMMTFVCLWYNGAYTFLRSSVIQSSMHL